MGKRCGVLCGLLAAGVVLTFGCSDANESAGTTTGKAARPGAALESGTKSAKAPGSGSGSGGAAAKEKATPADSAPKRTPAELVEAGRVVYNANCTACHNMNPALDGALGPAVAGSPYELLEARVVRGDYPEGYEPKRSTRVMVALPHLESQIDELTAYLASL